MKIAIAYVFPMVDVPKYAPLARRFTDTYINHVPGGTPHSLYVIANGEPLPRRLRPVFNPLPVTHLTHNNYGKDIGAFQMAADAIDCDLLVCFGSHIFFWSPGWLDRMVAAYLENGPTLYGAWGFHQPMPHIRTTAFWMAPALLRSYPLQVGNGSRYEFEHGQNSIVNHVKGAGFFPLVVTRREVLGEPHWHHVERDDCLFFDQHAESIGYH